MDLAQPQPAPGRGHSWGPRSASPPRAQRGEGTGGSVRDTQAMPDLEHSKPHFQIEPFYWKRALLSHVRLATYRITAWSSF